MGKSRQRKRAKLRPYQQVIIDDVRGREQVSISFDETPAIDLLIGQPRDAWVNEKRKFSPMLRMRMKTLIQYEQLVQAGRERVAQIEEGVQIDD